MWFVLTVLVTTAYPPNLGVSESALEQSDRAMNERRKNDAEERLLVAVTPNFVIDSYSGGPAAHEIAELCSSLRDALRQTWLGETSKDAWRPRCKVVLHATRKSYLGAVGRGGTQTIGSSLIEFEKSRVTTRRIDLLVDQRGQVSALPHELTHVVLADRFGGRQPPRWADEGIALLADSKEKQALHQRDCHDALRTGTALHVFELITLDRFMSSQQLAAFYGQSLTLVRFLAERDDSAKFVVFVELAMTRGYDQALRQTYNIEGVNHLQRLWLEALASEREASNNSRAGNTFQTAGFVIRR